MNPIKGFKGFDKDLKCRDQQYEVGKECVHTGDLSLCNSGLHFCEHPLDTFDYYTPGSSRYATVESSEVSEEKSTDSKRVAKRLRVVAELTLHNLCNIAAKFILDKVDFANAPATNTGEEGCAISLGIEGKAKGGKGCWLTLAEWKQIESVWHRVDVQTKLIDGEHIKADVFYQLRDGKFEEIQSGMEGRL